MLGALLIMIGVIGYTETFHVMGTLGGYLIGGVLNQRASHVRTWNHF